jgi:hypothetical protein
MFELLGILIVVALLVAVLVTWGVFKLVAGVLRLVFRALRFVVSPIFPYRRGIVLVACTRASCREVNPTTAAYCRRCGRVLTASSPRVRVPTTPPLPSSHLHRA